MTIDWRSRQNRDGGWSYGKGCSWTEPTAFVLLAQSATQIDRPSFEAGLRFLRSTQRPDGGWSPQPDVSESTWVTAAAALLPEEAIGKERLGRALDWLEGQTGRETSWSYRFQLWLGGERGGDHPDGWPWFPGAAAWVIPTSLGILAFERALARGGEKRFRERVDSGFQFLVERECADGGWNHGANKALGRDGDSYPETTGIALTALHGAQARNSNAEKVIERGKAEALRRLQTCRTAEGIAWLRMGLAAQGNPVKPPFDPKPRTTLDEALLTIASAPVNPLLSGSY